MIIELYRHRISVKLSSVGITYITYIPTSIEATMYAYYHELLAIHKYLYVAVFTTHMKHVHVGGRQQK